MSVNDVLVYGEKIVYQFVDNDFFVFVITNHRLIVITKKGMHSDLISSISSVSMLDGYDEWGDTEDDFGKGNYAVCWDSDMCGNLWFDSAKTRKEVYDEIMRSVIDEDSNL